MASTTDPIQLKPQTTEAFEAYIRDAEAANDSGARRQERVSVG